MASTSRILRARGFRAVGVALLGGAVLLGVAHDTAKAQAEPAILTTAPMPEPQAQAAPLSAFGLPCGLTVAATALPGAMVALDIIEPCRPHGRIEITHAALSITAKTDAAGVLTLDIPALEAPAFFIIRTDDGQEAVILAGVPDLSDHIRAAIGWAGDLQLELHAFEGGADFGAPGHIWRDAPGTQTNSLMGSGGFLTTLGDATLTAPHLAQVYSAPRHQRADLRLSVDIPITSASCGRPLRAQSLFLDDIGPPLIRPVALTVPGCDAVGDYLLLQNLFDTPRLVSN